jgi:hypothetical protein
MVQCHHGHGDVMMSSSILLVETQSTPADGGDSTDGYQPAAASEGHHCTLIDIDCSSAGRPLSRVSEGNNVVCRDRCVATKFGANGSSIHSTAQGDVKLP